MSLRFMCLQHAWFDNAGYLEHWAEEWGAELHYIEAQEPDHYPELKEKDVLVILGGPMSIHDLPDTEWMQREAAYIQKALDESHKVIGICLGSQYLAHLHGSKIETLERHEMGWGELDWSEEFLADFEVDQLSIPMFHWHQDLYDLPEGMKRMAGSELTPVQGFYNEQVLAFQFHPEITARSLTNFIDHDGEDIPNRDTSTGMEPPRVDPGYIDQSHHRFQPVLEKFLGTSAGDVPNDDGTV